MTQIVNLRHRKADKVCDRTSVFGNPYHIGKFTRDEACDLYEIYFNNRIKTDIKFKNLVLQLKGFSLGCWCRCYPPCFHPKCKSLRCHVETIIKYLENEA